MAVANRYSTTTFQWIAIRSSTTRADNGSLRALSLQLISIDLRSHGDLIEFFRGLSAARRGNFRFARVSSRASAERT